MLKIDIDLVVHYQNEKPISLSNRINVIFVLRTWVLKGKKNSQLTDDITRAQIFSLKDI